MYKQLKNSLNNRDGEHLHSFLMEQMAMKAKKNYMVNTDS